MLSVKHFIQLIIIIVVFSFMFLYLNVSNYTDVSQSSTNKSLELPDLINKPEDEMKQMASYYVVFSGGDEIEKSIYQNICLFLEDMKLPFERKKFVSESELSTGITLLFCNTKVSEGMDVKVLAKYIEQGGKAVFLSGLPEGYEESYLWPIWGIVEKGNRIESREWLLHKDVMPTREMKISYPDFQSSTKIKLDNQARILIEDIETKIPIVYQYDYGVGSSVIINGTLMQSKYSGGVFSATLGALQDRFLYPIIGTMTIFLNDYPFILSGYDRNCMDLYGHITQSFQRDVLWPVLVMYASRYGLKYTMNLYESSEIYDQNQLDGRLLKYLVKDNLRYSGEVMFSRDDSTKETAEIEALFKQYFPNYQIHAFHTQSDSESKKKIQIERETSQGENEKKEIVTFPIMSSGFVEQEQVYQYLAGLGLYGVVSHQLPIGQFITTTSKEESFDYLKQDLDQLMIMFGKDAKWLECATITEAAKRVIAYDQIQFKTRKELNKLNVSCSGFFSGQRFMISSKKQIVDIIGGSFKKINNSYYCIEAFKDEFTIIFEE